MPKQSCSSGLPRPQCVGPKFLATSCGLVLHASNHAQIAAVSSNIHAIARRQNQVRKGLNMNRQPLIPIIDPSLFAYALESAVQVPKYRKQVFFLVERYLNVDCHLVQRLTGERDEALQNNKNWAAYHSKILEQTNKHYKEQAHDREAHWERLHAAGLAGQKAGFDNQLTIMRTNFNSRLKREQEKTRAAEVKEMPDFSDVKAKLEKEASYQKARASNLQGQLVRAKASFAADRATLETKLEVQKGFRLQLRAKIEDLEVQRKQMTAEHNQEILHKRAMLELVNNMVGKLLEVADLQQDQLERKQAQIKDLGASKKQLMADQSQKLLQVKAERQAVKNAATKPDQQMQVADPLYQHLAQPEASETAKEKEIVDLKRQLGECQSTLEAKTV